MKSFLDYQAELNLSEDTIQSSDYISEELLNEALITLANKSYPKFGNIVIMAGGAGSGKGFVASNLLGMEGKTFDVDALKTLAMKAPKINAAVKKEFGVELNKMNLKRGEDVAKLHEIVGDALALPKKSESAFMASVLAGDPRRRPNIIFDVTLKDLQKLMKITRMVSELGYDKKLIHIVWVVNDIEVAKQQNKARDRVVPEKILINTHRGVSMTMKDIIEMGDGIRQYLDGDIVFAFNKAAHKNTRKDYRDSSLAKSKIKDKHKGSFTLTKKQRERAEGGEAPKGGQYIEKGAKYFYIKRSGKSTTPFKEIADSILRKIDKYAPPVTKWSNK